MTTTPATFTTATAKNPAAVLRPFRAHRLYPAAVAAVERVKVHEGTAEASALARRIAVEFEEVSLRETANRIRMTMEAAPGVENDCD
ncbi:hypothetical protein GCM10029963_28320 [Micromonospora andamanensis]|uniref:hypothetical protein n=1 Tax=Micromonospora andamanensis TaxID=1287068 RepID=UPI001951631A|nr:hypothetical protein [Micromonospora andamanensis]GIJ38536.1 hypothetical protein Vwe01_18610 [Micromonospora andamanensis]